MGSSFPDGLDVLLILAIFRFPIHLNVYCSCHVLSFSKLKPYVKLLSMPSIKSSYCCTFMCLWMPNCCYSSFTRATSTSLGVINRWQERWCLALPRPGTYPGYLCLVLSVSNCHDLFHCIAWQHSLIATHLSRIVFDDEWRSFLIEGGLHPAGCVIIWTYLNRMSSYLLCFVQ